MELSPDGIVVSVDGRIVFANPAATGILGVLRPDDLVGKTILDLVHPDSRAQATRWLEQVVSAGGEIPSIELRVVRSDGSMVVTECSAAPVAYRGQRAIQAVIRDVTERRELERHGDLAGHNRKTNHSRVVIDQFQYLFGIIFMDRPINHPGNYSVILQHASYYKKSGCRINTPLMRITIIERGRQIY